MIQISKKTSRFGSSPSDGLVSYTGHFLRAGVLALCRNVVGVFYSLRMGSSITNNMFSGKNEGTKKPN